MSAGGDNSAADASTAEDGSTTADTSTAFVAAPTAEEAAAKTATLEVIIKH